MAPGRRRATGSGGNKKGARASFGSIRRLTSGRYQARFTAPDGSTEKAPTTFDTAGDAQAWLALRRSEVIRGKWRPPVADTDTRFGDYATLWIAGRDLKPRTREHYELLHAQHLAGTFDAMRVRDITPERVRAWHSRMGRGTPTVRAHAYSLLRAILTTATEDGIIDANPCHIRGAGNAKRVHRIEPATPAELAALADAMPPRYRAAVLLAGWVGLRFGELTELRRGDLAFERATDGTTEGCTIRVRRAVTRVGGEYVVGTPKSEAGVRDVAVPPHLLGTLEDHLRDHVGRGRDALLFPAAGDPTKHLAPSALYKVFYPAREAAGRPDLRWHDLRHTGQTLAAMAGATQADLMHRLGHSTAAASQLYMHAARGRDAEIARLLSQLAAPTV